MLLSNSQNNLSSYSKEEVLFLYPNFYHNYLLYSQLSEVASVINHLGGFFPSFTVFNNNYLDKKQKLAIEYKFKLGKFIKEIVLQYALHNNFCFSYNGIKQDNDVYTLGDDVWLTALPLQNTSLYRRKAGTNIISSFTYREPTFPSFEVQNDFYFYSGVGASNCFFGDSKIDSLSNKLECLNRDELNFKKFLKNNAYPGLIISLENEMTKEQEVTLAEAVRKWQQSEYYYEPAIIDNADGLKFNTIENKVNNLTKEEKEYIWQSTLACFGIPSDFILKKNGGLSAEELRTMRQVIFDNFITPTLEAIEPVLVFSVFPSILNTLESRGEDVSGLSIELEPFALETFSQKLERMQKEVTELGRPLDDYFEVADGIGRKDQYEHHKVYFFPNNRIITDINEKINTDYRENQLSVVRENEQAAVTPIDTNKDNIALAEGGVGVDTLNLPQTEKKTDNTSQLKAEIPLDEVFTRLTPKQKDRVREFSFQPKEGDISGFEAVLVKKEFTSLLDKTKSAVKEQLRIADIGNYFNKSNLSTKAEDSEEAEPDNISLLALLQDLYVIGLFGYADAMRFVKEAGLDNLSIEERTDLESNLKNYLVARITSITKAENQGQLSQRNKTRLEDDSFRQFRFEDIDVNQTSKKQLNRMIESANKKAENEEEFIQEIERLVVVNAANRADIIAKQEAINAYAYTQGLVYEKRKPKSKTKLPTSSNKPRELHQSMNGETVAYNKAFSDGSYFFPSPAFFNCSCGMRVNY
jgi:hypothetical protein